MCASGACTSPDTPACVCLHRLVRARRHAAACHVCAAVLLWCATSSHIRSNAALAALVHQAVVLFSDISGFTKLTNRLLAEYGNEGAEILNGIINRFFDELIHIITR